MRTYEYRRPTARAGNDQLYSMQLENGFTRKPALYTSIYVLEYVYHAYGSVLGNYYIYAEKLMIIISALLDGHRTTVIK